MAGMHCCDCCSLEGEAPTFTSRGGVVIGSERENERDRDQQAWIFPQCPNALIEARSAEADRYVNNVLLSLDDETLKSHGYSRAELSAGAERPNRFWVLSASGGASPSPRAGKRADVAEALADIGGEHGVALALEDA